MPTKEQEEFRQEMLQDAYADKANEIEEAKLDYALTDDYDFFREHYANVFEMAIDAIRELKRIHELHEQEFDVRDLGDEL